MRGWQIVPVLIGMLMFAAGCAPRDDGTLFSGPTMGTTYHIIVADPVDESARENIRAYIDSELRDFSAHLSTYDPRSEISRLNGAAINQWIPVSPLLYEVIRISAQVSRESGGAFDITIGSLVARWGFGPDSEKRKQSASMQAPQSLAELSQGYGWQKLELRTQPVLAVRKRDAGIRLDVNGVAPGLEVDRIVAGLVKMGFTNTLVEIGGEVRGQGRRSDGRPWQVAVEAPVAGERTVYAGLQVLNRAVSTSGDYRDSRLTTAGQRISHTIDPHTGSPITNGLASVTVIAPTAAEADAYATALSVLGSRDGYTLAIKLGLPVLFIDRTSVPGKWRERSTPAFERLRRPVS